MKVNYSTIIIIIICSSVLGFAVNFLSTKGIPIIAEKKLLTWADDSIFELNDIQTKETEVEIIDEPVEKTKTEETEKEIPPQNLDKPEVEKKPEVKETPEEKKDEAPVPTEPAAINIQQAYRLFEQNILFIDAREKSDYDYAHIKGAINIPFDHFDEYKNLLNGIDKSRTIVTYCGGSDCDLSIMLGNLLFDLGYKKTFIFFGGWNDWLQAGYPTQSNLQE